MIKVKVRSHERRLDKLGDPISGENNIHEHLCDYVYYNSSNDELVLMEHGACCGSVSLPDLVGLTIIPFTV